MKENRRDSRYYLSTYQSTCAIDRWCTSDNEQERSICWAEAVAVLLNTTNKSDNRKVTTSYLNTAFCLHYSDIKDWSRHVHFKLNEELVALKSQLCCCCWSSCVATRSITTWMEEGGSIIVMSCFEFEIVRIEARERQRQMQSGCCFVLAKLTSQLAA